MAYLGFDASNVEPADFTALPTGDYAVVITDSEFKNSRQGSQYLALTFQVIEGQGKGRNLWHNLNLSHPSQKAQDIAQRELSAICRAVGKMAIQDSAELHNIPLRVHVAYVPAKDEFPEGNRIKKWMPYSQSPSPTATRPQAAASATRPQSPPPSARPQAAPSTNKAAQPPAAGKTPPWRKPKHQPEDAPEDAPEVRQEAVEDDVPY